MKKLTLIFIIAFISIFTFAQDLTVHFKFDKSQPDEKSKVLISELLQKSKTSSIILKGFADTVGTVSYNKLLAQKRIESVVEVLRNTDQSINIEKINLGEAESSSDDLRFRKVDIYLSETKAYRKEPNYKKPQSFFIDNLKDTIIECTNGTKIEIPKNSLRIKENNAKPSGFIEFQVTEYYEIPEMIDADLTTQSGHEMLETGGMLYIQAFSEGKECEVENKAGIGIHFRNITESDSMQIFTGNKTNNGIDWKLSEYEIIKDSELEPVFFLVENMPSFLGGSINSFEAYVNTRLRYPVIAQEMGIQGKVYVTFVIDKKGLIKDPKIIKSAHPSLSYEVLRAIQSTPRWTPGTQKGKSVSVSVQIPFNFVLDGGLPIDNTNRVTSNSECDTFIQNDSVIKAYKKQNEFLNSFFLRTNKLGWINCDKFYRYPDKRDIEIVTKTKFENYYAIFNNNRSILRQNLIGKHPMSVGFKNIPAHQKTLIIGIKITDKDTWFTSFETNSDKDTYTPTFEKIDKSELIHKMKKLGL